MGFECNGEEKLFHELFGVFFGIQKGEWLRKLQQKNVTLSDVGTGSAEIELLIGNDISGKLLTAIERLEEYENFVAMNYSIGWTIMGKMPTSVKTDKTLLIHSLLVKEANVSDLWRLDLIGIEDEAETKKKEMNLEAATEQFKQTLRIDQEGRFEISLPFIKGCPPLKSNRSMAEQRLLSMTRRLSPELRNVYQKVLDDWESAGIDASAKEGKSLSLNIAWKRVQTFWKLSHQSSLDFECGNTGYCQTSRKPSYR